MAVSRTSSVADVEVLEQRVRRAELQAERDVGMLKSYAEVGKRAARESEDLASLADACEQAAGYMNSFADERLGDVYRKIEDLVTYGLRTIFDRDDISLHVKAETKASRLETTFWIRSGIGGEVLETPVLEAHGGGVSAIVGFLLRLVLTLLSGRRPLLLLDETFAHVSSQYEPRLAEFLAELVEKTSAQIILVTHSETYADYADKVYRFDTKQGKTQVEVLK